MIGLCRLCRRADCELQESHIIPKWCYRRASAPNDPPVLVTAGRAVQTSTQIKEHLLCRDCEELVCRDEDWVSRLAYQADGTLGLLTGANVEEIPEHDIRFVLATALQPKTVARFACSVFWRAHVSSRPECANLRLWEPQAEALRRHVLGEAPLTSNICVSATALVGADGGPTAHSFSIIPPGTGKKGDDGFHQFLAAGLLFTLSTGLLAVENRELCLACCLAPPIALSRWERIRTLLNLTGTMRAAKAVGRLAKPRSRRRDRR
jgi:hypothetical protein